MSISALHLQTLVIQPFLKSIGLYSLSAEQLLLGTAAVESTMGSFLKQNGGPGLGIYSIEPFTYQDMWANFLSFRSDLSKKVLYACGYVVVPDQSALVINLGFSTLMARLRYLRCSAELPAEGNVYAMAQYWKDNYNTALGAGDLDDFQDSYIRYVQPLYK